MSPTANSLIAWLCVPLIFTTAADWAGAFDGTWLALGILGAMLATILVDVAVLCLRRRGRE